MFSLELTLETSRRSEIKEINSKRNLLAKPHDVFILESKLCVNLSCYNPINLVDFPIVQLGIQSEYMAGIP